jgi:hypothetical protein
MLNTFSLLYFSEKISADEFFKATGICIQEPVSTIKATEEYLQTSNPSDHIYSSINKDNNIISIAENTLAIDIDTDNNTTIDIHNADTMAIDIDNDNTNIFSMDAISYLDLINSLPASMINTSDTDLSSVEISDLPFINSEKTLCINKVPENILKQLDDTPIINYASNTVKSIEVMTQTDVEASNDQLAVNQINLRSSNSNLDKIVQTDINCKDNKLDESTQTEFYVVENKLDDTTQTEFSFLKYKLNKKKLKKVLQSRRLKIKELKHKVKQNYVNIINNITLEQYELLTEKFFPKETSDFIKIQAQLYKQKSNDRRYSI